MYIGIDLHKETCYATTLDKEGEVVDRREFKNLAKLLRADFLPHSYIPSREIRENREVLRLRVQLGKDRTVVKNRIHAVLAKNGVKHEFTDLFGVGGRIFLREIELPKSQRIALDVLLRQLESVDKEVEYVQKQIAVIARGDGDVKILMTIP